MANKYIIHGATYCGDGTANTDAASAGAVGAWNNLNIQEGTTPPYGALGAGDVLFVRSKDAAGNDITISKTTATTLGSAAATLAAPIYWVIDDGAVWPGVSGTITYSFSTQVTCTFRNYNHIICSPGYNFVVQNTMAAFGAAVFCVLQAMSSRNLKIDGSACTTSFGPYHTFGEGVHENIWFRSYARHLNLITNTANGGSNTTFYNPKIELLNPAELEPVFSCVGYFNSAPLTVFGGEVFGAGAVEGVALVRSAVNTGGFRSFGLKYPRVMPLSTTTYHTTTSESYANGCDGILGNAYFGYYYAYDSRDDGYYPTLNASLETSTGDNWSYKLYPYRTNNTLPAQIAISKVWTQADAIKTVTLELLWPKTMAAPTADKVWMSVQYTDAATGVKKTHNTRVMTGGTLASSTAGWSAVTYGPALFDKYKLSVTTDTSIKQDTEVMVVFFSIPTSASSNDVIFLDADATIA